MFNFDYEMRRITTNFRAASNNFFQIGFQNEFDDPSFHFDVPQIEDRIFEDSFQRFEQSFSSSIVEYGPNIELEYEKKNYKGNFNQKKIIF